MKERLFLGVDGGGSKTTAVVANEYGEIVAAEVGGSINYYSNPLESVRANMSQIIEKIYKKTGNVKFDGAFIGMSALSERADDNALRSFADGVINADCVCMDSDLYIAMEAMLCKKECAVVISGTGSMVIARGSDGTIKHAGGWGYILGDEGSGYSISLRAIKAAVRGFEGSGEKTQLTEEIKDMCKVESLYDITDIFYNPPVDRKFIASFMSRVRRCADGGDEVAADIIKGEASELASTAMSLLKNMPRDITVGLWGGVFQYTPMFSRHFKTLLSENGIDNVSLLTYPPEIGAVFGAYKLCGVTVNEAMLKNIRKTYMGEDAE